MNVVRISDVKPEDVVSKMFTGGRVTSQRLVDEKMSQGLRLTVVTFSAGAKNLMHSHTNEQVLFVTEGKGIVATEKEEVVVTPGMLVYIPAGEKHWHGAVKDSSFAHISIATPGKTIF